MRNVLDYKFGDRSIESSEGGFPLNFPAGTVIRGPTSSSLGRLSKALNLGGEAAAATDISALSTSHAKFCIRVVVRTTTEVTGRQNIVESNRLPFALFLDKGETSDRFIVVGSVNSQAHGWRAVDTRFQQPALRTGQWLSIDLAYDHDTLALFVNERLVDLQAFPSGPLAEMTGTHLFVGSWTDGRRNRFAGDIAALQVIDGIPEALEATLDEQRAAPAWFISHKRLAIEATVRLGGESGPVRFDRATTAYIQDFEHGAVIYHDSMGAAFVIHGAIYAFYKSYTGKSALGFLVTDESATTRRGGRKSLFSKGGIYWSSATGAVPVVGQIYLDYESLGESAFLGFPTAPARRVGRGFEQIFQSGRMYHEDGEARAHEVHGAILSRFIASGGVGRWGFPVANESDVRQDSQIIGRSSEFEGATFFWSARTGAFEVHDDIRRQYMNMKGPSGELGFPTSDERNIPGVSGPGRMNSFERGSICWYGSFSSIVVARPFKIFVGRVATRENEGFTMGQNDLYTNIRASDGSQTYDRRHPSSGDWGGHNSRDINLTIPNTFTPNQANYSVSFRFRVRDADPGNDDELGTFTKTLNAANGWGLRENQGVFNESFSRVRSLTWSVKPQVDVSLLSETDKWWGKDNTSTAEIDYQRYARAFRDVDSDAEWWDLSDWLEKAFYELVVDSMASGGNCFGMSLEGIYARKNLSPFGMPLSRFRTWSHLEPEFNIKHCYQVGAEAIWWFMGQFVTGNTHDPKDVFRRTRDHFNRGKHPVLCVSQNYDFSGAPHCILPVGWNDSTQPWRIELLDPNFPNQLRVLTVDPNLNTFFYDGGSNDYRGSEWSGGRLHFMPFSILDGSPRTPIWDAILLILSGVVIILGSDAETVSIKDDRGTDLDAFGTPATRRLQADDPIDNCFFGVKGFAGEAIAGELLLRKAPLRASTGILAGNGALVAHLPIGSLLRERTNALTHLRDALSTDPQLRSAVSTRTAVAVLADPRLRTRLSPAIVEALGGLASANHEGAYDHRVRSKRNGRLEYAVKSAFNGTKLSTTATTGELTDVNVRDMGTSKWRLDIVASRDKLADIVYETRLGAGIDRVEVDLSSVPMKKRQPMQMNVKPGLGGIELMAGGERVNVRMTVKAHVDGREIRREYKVPLEGGARLNLAHALSEGDLVVKRIESIFGPSVATSRLRPR